MKVNGIQIKTISRFPGYAVSQDGRVWSLPKRGSSLDGKWLSPGVIKEHWMVTLSANLRTYTCYIHRLVLETYVGPCPEGKECRHLNGNPADNRLENLKWGTRKENAEDRTLHGRTARGETSGMSKLTDDKVRAIRYLREVAKFSLSDLVWQFGVVKSVISAIVNRKTWKHVDSASLSNMAIT